MGLPMFGTHLILEAWLTFPLRLSRNAKPSEFSLVEGKLWSFAPELNNNAVCDLHHWLKSSVEPRNAWAQNVNQASPGLQRQVDP